jgi:hypothetical protein
LPFWKCNDSCFHVVCRGPCWNPISYRFSVSVGSCSPPRATGGDYPNRLAVRCLMLPPPPSAQSANVGLGRWERLENGWNKDTEKGIRIKV